MFKVRSIDITYDPTGALIESVNIRFDSVDSSDVWLNGLAKITEAEYNANANNLQGLADLALTKVKAKLGVI